MSRLLAFADRFRRSESDPVGVHRLLSGSHHLKKFGVKLATPSTDHQRPGSIKTARRSIAARFFLPSDRFQTAHKSLGIFAGPIRWAVHGTQQAAIATDHQRDGRPKARPSFSAC
jgi:predicted RNase H-like nuclease (RuvC/YqgF family)